MRHHRIALIALYLYTPSFDEIGITFCGWTDGRTYVRTDTETGFVGLTVNLKIVLEKSTNTS